MDPFLNWAVLLTSLTTLYIYLFGLPFESLDSKPATNATAPANRSKSGKRARQARTPTGRSLGSTTTVSDRDAKLKSKISTFRHAQKNEYSETSNRSCRNVDVDSQDNFEMAEQHRGSIMQSEYCQRQSVTLR